MSRDPEVIREIVVALAFLIIVVGAALFVYLMVTA